MSLVLLVVMNNIVSVKYTQEIIYNERQNGKRSNERMKKIILVS